MNEADAINTPAIHGRKKRDYSPMPGKRFGRLTVIERQGTHVYPKGTKAPLWRCRCDCGNESVVTRGALSSGTTVSCGCFNRENARRLGKARGTKPEEVKSKFWERVKIGKPDECWEWTWGKTTRGYGVMWACGVKQGAHAMAYTLTNGTIPNGKIICHHCDNPPCCNPRHLYAGTHADNSRDKHSRGRANLEKGEDRYNAKLTQEQVDRIKREAPTRTYGWGRRLAKEFGVGPTAISNIVAGRRWK